MRRPLRAAAIAAGAVLLVVVPLASAAPPVAPTITGPSGTINDTTPTFTFSSAGATGYTCSVAGPTSVGPTACDGGSFTTPALADGAYTFSVTASNADGPSGPSARAFTVDATPPPTPTISGPSGTINDNTPAFTFSSAGATGYTCSVAGPTSVGPTACNGGSFTTPALADGAYTFSVTASDVGGTSAAATRTFTVDATPPPTPTISGPSGTINDNTPAFTFSSAGATGYTCSVAGPTSVGPTACNGGSFTTPALADGAYTFSVTSSDSLGNTSAAATRTFTVDATPPPTPTINGPSGTINDPTPTFTFTAAGATGFKCSIDAPATPTVACSSPFTPAAALADGAHSFHVTASDSLGNTSTVASRAFTVDATPPPAPTISGPSGATKEAAPVFTFTAAGATGFNCSIDAPTTPTADCSSPFAPAAALADGPHTFYVTADDDGGNTSTVASQPFTVDTTPPVLKGPGNVIIEADGPGGTRVGYTVTASDGTPPAPLLPGAVTCNPTSPSQFGLGRSTVGCTATDAVGNSGTLSFTVTVVDTTPPTINAPDASFTATSASGIARTDPALAAYLSRISATDLVSTATVTTSTPERLPVGETKIVVTARDDAGNEARKTVTLTVLAPGTPAPPPDFTPPGPLRSVAAKAADHAVLLSWALPADKDVAFVRITRSVVGRTATTVVFRGLRTSFTSKGLSNGVAYRFTLVAVDKAGNSSRPVVRSATPKAVLLAAPKLGAVLVKPPLLRWAPVSMARYFNVQLYRSGVKILSAWPTVARLQLTGRWKYDGRAFTLKPGRYTWYVWPGIGARADARYGELLGKSSFSVAAAKKL